MKRAGARARQAEAPSSRPPGEPSSEVIAVPPSVYLHPGQVHASREACTITTVLGSCVSVCLFDMARGVGGANHFLLPIRPGEGTASPRFGNVAIETLLERMLALGCVRGDLRAKIFGGASNAAVHERSGESLGAHNVLLARRVLGDLGIPILAEDVGGTRGRKLVLRTDIADVWVRKL